MLKKMAEPFRFQKTNIDTEIKNQNKQQKMFATKMAKEYRIQILTNGTKIKSKNRLEENELHTTASNITIQELKDEAFEMHDQTTMEALQKFSKTEKHIRVQNL